MRMKIMMNKIKNFFRSDRVLRNAVYGFTFYGLISAWAAFAFMVTDPLGVFIPVLAFFGLMFSAKTYSAWVAHNRSERAWMLAVAWVPLSEIYYIYSRKLRSV